MVAKLPYDLMQDFAPVTLIGTSPLVLFASPQFGSLTEFLNAARANSGGTAVAHSSPGTVSHLTAALLASATGVSFIYVSYRGTAPAMIDVASGQVAAHVATMAGAGAMLSDGKVRALAVTGDKRLALLPDVPTFSEAGIGNLMVEQWWALVALAAFHQARRSGKIAPDETVVLIITSSGSKDANQQR